jgi:hypothetical protein
MVPLTELWLPVVLSAVAVFILSSFVWMVFPWHRKDFQALPDEGAARSALRGARPGLYTVPNAADRAEAQSADHKKKMEEGPVAFVVMLPNGDPSMSRSLVQWFVWSLVVSFTVAYVLSNSVPASYGFIRPFQVGGTIAWLAYSWAYAQEGIWFGRPWSYVAKQFLDGLLYALATGAIFGLLWP